MIDRHFTAVGLVALGLLGSLSARAQNPQEEKAKAAIETPWQERAQLAGLSQPAIAHLKEEKVLMTKDTMFQCFEAYLPQYHRQSNDIDLPYFITTDALFQAYAWCLQKAIASIEESNASTLPEVLRAALVSLKTIDQRIQGDAAAIRSAQSRAQFVMGVAASLMELNVKPYIKDEALRNDIAEEVARIQKAVDTGGPARLKLPATAFTPLDYAVFKPVSFYSSDPDLSAYFRTIRWLQLIPFRSDSDEDMLASQMLVLGFGRARLKELGIDPEVASWFQDQQRLMEDLAGPADQSVIDLTRTLYDADQEAPKAKAAALIEAANRISVIKPESKSGLAITSTLSPGADAAPCVYLVAGARLNDAEWLERLSQHHGSGYFPNALSIASWLGSAHAVALEKADDKVTELRNWRRQSLNEDIDKASLHTQTLALLQRLFEPPPADAPTFMKSRAWSVKSCQTALAAWAQSRHVWALQARPHYAVSSAIPDWPAFVEPNPDFFTGLAGLCDSLGKILARSQTGGPSLPRIERQLRRMADAFDPAIKDEAWPYKERLVRQQMRDVALEMLLEAGVPYPDDKHPHDPELLGSFAQHLRQSAEQIERGEADSRHPIAQKLLARLSLKSLPPLDQLANTCLRLSVLAHKQMRGQKPRPEEYKWLRYFGVRLALFSDSHFAGPVDDVPKAVRIFTNPTISKALTVGIGRPSFLYVLYPWDGREILCRGAVLPYLERHQMDSLTDAEWQSGLGDAQNPPIQPDWLRPLLSE